MDWHRLFRRNILWVANGRLVVFKFRRNAFCRRCADYFIRSVGLDWHRLFRRNILWVAVGRLVVFEFRRNELCISAAKCRAGCHPALIAGTGLLPNDIPPNGASQPSPHPGPAAGNTIIISFTCPARRINVPSPLEI